MSFVRTPVIPRAELKPGIAQCFGKARDQLDGALLLVNAGRAESAANLYVLAIQELGKAQLLREAFDSGDESPEIASFANHDAKVEKGFLVAGSSAMWLKRGAFQSGTFQTNAFDIGVRADEPTRLDVLYVNYGSTGWLKPPPIDVAELTGNIVGTLGRLSEKEAELLR